MAPLPYPSRDATSMYLQMLSDESQPTMYPQGVLLVVLSGMAILLDIPPLIWHLSKRNTAMGTLIVWLILLNAMNLVNVFIWPNDNLPTRWEGTGLCDVEIKLQLGSYVGLPGALACIMRALVNVLDTKSANVVPSAGKRRRNTAFMLIFCFGFPLYVMATHYIVQPNRYSVWAISGCTPTTDGSWLSLFLIYLWPVILSVIDAYYAMFLIVRMQKYRSEFSRLLEHSNTTKSRFLRLFVISMILVVVLMPLQIYILYRNVEGGVRRFSWPRTHGKDWNYITPVPTHGQVIFDRWIRVGAGFLVFGFFGIGTDAARMYRGWMARIVGFYKVSSSSSTQCSSTSRVSWRDWFGITKVKAKLSRINALKSRKDTNRISPTGSFSTSSQSTQQKGLLSSAMSNASLSISDIDASSGSFKDEARESA